MKLSKIAEDFDEYEDLPDQDRTVDSIVGPCSFAGCENLEEVECTVCHDWQCIGHSVPLSSGEDPEYICIDCAEGEPHSEILTPPPIPEDFDEYEDLSSVDEIEEDLCIVDDCPNEGEVSCEDCGGSYCVHHSTFVPQLDMMMCFDCLGAAGYDLDEFI